jgi:hypothetical protein
MSRRITEKQRAVNDTIRMHLRHDKALVYMKDQGYEMGQSTWYRWVQKLNNSKRERLYEIARIGYEEEHTDSIEEIETARKLLWKEYEECKGSVSRAAILEKIINTRPLLSSYYDSTKEVVEKPVVKEDSDIQITEQPTTTDDWV